MLCRPRRRIAGSRTKTSALPSATEMPLEALRYDVTPIGLHYLLGHFDIPAVDPDTWNLEIRGLVARPQTFSLGELRQMPSSSMAVTLECAGNGRTLMEPFPGGQP